MRTDVTIIGFFQRQMAASLAPAAVLITVILIYLYGFSADARDRGASGRDNDYISTQSSPHLNWDANQPRFQQPFLQPGSLNTQTLSTFNKDQFVLWPGTISYTRPVKFMAPYLMPDLKLGIQYTYNFTFYLRSRDTDMRWSQVPDGWYLMTLAVILPENTSGYFSRVAAPINVYDRYVTSSQIFVKVSGGMVNRKVAMKFDNLSATTIINHLIMEFQPLENDCAIRNTNGKLIKSDTCIKTLASGEADPLRSKIIPKVGYKPQLCEMPFVPYMANAGSACNPDEASTILPLQKESLNEYIVTAKSRKPQIRSPKTPTPRDIADKRNLKLLSTNDPLILAKMGSKRAAQKVGDEFNKIFNRDGAGAISLEDDSRWFIYGLCNLLAETNVALQKTRGADKNSMNPATNNLANLIQRCSYKPSEYFRMTKVTHLYNFDLSKTRATFTQPLRTSLQTNFMVSRSHTTDISGGVTPAQVGFKLLDAFGLGLTGINYSITYSNSRSKSESTSGSTSLGLDFNLIGMVIPTAKSQRCLEIVPIAYSNSPFYNGSPNAPHNGVYICEEQSDKPTNVTETYAHVFVHAGETSIVDAFDSLTQSVNLAMRGDREISSFFYLTRKGMTAEHNNSLQPFEMLPSAENYFKYTPPTETRLVVNPIHFAQESAPSVGSLISFSYSERFVDDN